LEVKLQTFHQKAKVPNNQKCYLRSVVLNSSVTVTRTSTGSCICPTS